MKNKLEDYVVVIKDAVPTKLCDKAIKEFVLDNDSLYKLHLKNIIKDGTTI